MKPSDLLLAPIPKRVSLLGGSMTLPARGFVIAAGKSPSRVLFAAVIGNLGTERKRCQQAISHRVFAHEKSIHLDPVRRSLIGIMLIIAHPERSALHLNPLETIFRIVQKLLLPFFSLSQVK